ncbi:MAG: matrixin family metalloprotease [Burkholderiaceae bacterium]
MPRTEDWARLQVHLVNHGYLAANQVVDVRAQSDISPALIGAVQDARRGIEGPSHHGTVIEIDRVEQIVPILDALSNRFCGVPDQGGSLGPLTFGSPGGRWTRGNLRVSINPAGCRPVGFNPVPIIVGAFTQWQAAGPFFSFTFVPPSAPADIRVIFGGQAIDSRFGSAGGVLASAGYPPTGNLQFDNVETWNNNALLSTALHEIGHLLGLSHSNRPGGTMNPFVNTLLTIDAESQSAIRSIYGWEGQRNLPDRGTSHRAMLGITSWSNFTSSGQTVHMVWKGVGNDSGIYFSDFDGANWTPQARVGGVGCSFSPALTEVSRPGVTPGTGLLMAWKGVGSDSGIYWTRNLGNGWEPQRRVNGVGASAAPSLANVNGQVFMAWKGVGNDTGIYWSTYDGNEGWAAQQNVRGVGTSDSPALVSYQNSLYMFWKGIPGDSNVWYSFLDVVNDPIWKPQRRVEYFDYQTGGGISIAIGTSGAPSVTARGNSILLAWKGVQGDSSIWYSLFRNGEFSGQATVPNVGTSIGPSVVEADGRTFMAWKGVEGDSGIYWTRL